MLQDEWEVLDAISAGSGCFPAGECFRHFSGIMRETQLSRERVRDACRTLTDRGLATYSHGLVSEDGTPNGSGYGATRRGLKLLNIQ